MQVHPPESPRDWKDELLVERAAAQDRDAFLALPKGGQHGTPRTKGGCLLLVTCGLVAA